MTTTTKPAAKSAAKKAPKGPENASPFASLGDKLKKLGQDAGTMRETNGGDLAWIDIDKIDIEPQQRTETFDGEDSTIESLGGTIQEMGGLLQTILLTPREGGRFLLVAGERRLRALIANGEKRAPCFIRILSESQILDAQFLENVERQKLSSLELTRAIARRKQALLDDGVPPEELTAALLKKYGRKDTPSNRTWLSNMESLQSLGEAGLAAMSLTSNAQAVAAVARLEKQDPVAAAAVVAEVQAETSESPRAGAAGKRLIDKAQTEKNRIREQKGKPERANQKDRPKKPAAKAGEGAGTSTATPPDHSDREPSAVTIKLPGLGDGTAVTRQTSTLPLSEGLRDPDGPEFGLTDADVEHAAQAGHDDDDQPSFELFDQSEAAENVHPGVPLLTMVLTDVEAGASPKDAIAALSKEDADKVRDFLGVFFEAGRTSREHHIAVYVMAGLQRGVFGYTGIYGAQLSAFLHGCQNDNPRFHLLNIIGAMRKVRIEVND